jgi:hypothetical protein
LTVQKVCRLARDEDEVKRTLDYVWSDSENAAKILKDLQEGNEARTRGVLDACPHASFLNSPQPKIEGFTSYKLNSSLKGERPQSKWLALMNLK